MKDSTLCYGKNYFITPLGRISAVHITQKKYISTLGSDETQRRITKWAFEGAVRPILRSVSRTCSADQQYICDHIAKENSHLSGAECLYFGQ
jgi:hypothetical protein